MQTQTISQGGHWGWSPGEDLKGCIQTEAKGSELEDKALLYKGKKFPRVGGSSCESMHSSGLLKEVTVNNTHQPFVRETH